MQANASKIVDKYRELKLLKQHMTKMKRDFNARILKLQDEKRKKCAILSEQIEKFRHMYQKLCPHDGDIEVDTLTENVLYFDGNSFKVECWGRACARASNHVKLANVLKCPLHVFQEYETTVQILHTTPLPVDALNEMEKQQMDIKSATLYCEQALLFSQIDRIYRDFDAKIKDAAEQSLEISLQIQFLELYYFVLYQELLVLNRFEEPHKALLRSIKTAQDKMKANDDEIKATKHQLKEYIGEDSLVSTSGKIIDMELLFRPTGTLTNGWRFWKRKKK